MVEHLSVVPYESNIALSVICFSSAMSIMSIYMWTIEDHLFLLTEWSEASLVNSVNDYYPPKYVIGSPTLIEQTWIYKREALQLHVQSSF